MIGESADSLIFPIEICSYKCSNINDVAFEWEARKAALNLRKHGISFSAAVEVFRDPDRVERLDDTEDYGETRWIAVGLVDGIVLVVVYVFRQNNIRIISARKGNCIENENYWNR